jgi:hypothetical protein
MCDEGYAVPYAAQNKSLVEGLHLENRKKLIERGEIDA